MASPVELEMLLPSLSGGSGNCGNCVFYSGDGFAGHSDYGSYRERWGHCRRNGKVLYAFDDGSSKFVFPDVGRGEWCGEHRSRKPKARTPK